ncbi:hypothetical protein SAMN05444920_13336 [Nonomuraea solani]|uniref:Uncharacterized protein n=1 Tax=Nonomuraea solani TaxID=1144553 RepID=A0A1H6EZB0_9ACTN|nr:hypothetical protein [Nonomuraea solani]SEH03132.1 hypothetical protein SAMN05444920_13336 [Nonomuraea solani]
MYEEIDITQHNIGYEVGALPAVLLPNVLSEDVVAKKESDSRLPGKGTIQGQGVTDVEERALRWLLAHYSTYEIEGKTYRQILPIGPGAEGQVVLTYDQDRNATARLVGRGRPMNDPAGNPENLKRELIATYSLRTITGGWTPVDLTKLQCALALVKQDDRPALRGLELGRVPQLPPAPGGEPDLGVFRQKFGPNITSLGTIDISTAMFDRDAKGFYEGSDGIVYPVSVIGILHEIGHAVASVHRRTEARRNSGAAVATTQPGVYGEVDLLSQDDITNATTLRYGTEDIEKVVDLAENAYSAALGPPAQAAAAIGFCEQQGGKMAGLAQAARNYAANKTAALGTELKKHRALVMDDANAIMDDYERAIGLNRRSEAGDHPSDDEYNQLRNRLTATPCDAPWAIFHAELIRWCDIDFRSNAWRRKYEKKEGDRTGRELSFKQYAQNQGIGQDLTPYTKQFPATAAGFAELYAEAYALSHIDPVALTTHNAALATYFTGAQPFYRQGDGN